MTVVRREHLADAGGWAPSAGRRGRLAAALCLVTAAHLLILARFPNGPSRLVTAMVTPAVALELAPPSFRVLAATPAPSPMPPAKATAPVEPVAKAPPAPDPDPKPPQPAPDPTAMATNPPPLDLTAEPVQLTPTPAPAKPAAAGPAAATPASASTCDLTNALKAALQNDVAVRNDLALIPRQAKSVANAIQLWDGAWADDRALGGPGVADPIRAAVVAVVRQAPPTCHDQTVLGPRLFAVVDPRGTTVVALGSGLWKWSDLLDTAPAMPGS